MTTDLHLTVTNTSVSPPVTSTSRLSWATSIFYFGQLAGSYPMAYTVQHFTTRNVLCPAVIIWGIICAATAGVTSWQGLFAQRFFLGLLLSRISINWTNMGRLHRIHHPNRIHDNGQRLLHPTRTSPPSKLVVLRHRLVHHHRRRTKLRLCTDQERQSGTLAIHLHLCWMYHCSVRNMDLFPT